MSQDDQAPVLFEERRCSDGNRIGFATLNAPRTLNGFSLGAEQSVLYRMFVTPAR